MSETDSDLSRLEQQEDWRKKLGVAELEYQHASEGLRQAVLSSNVDGGSVQEVEAARERKAQARREYLRILRVFTDLVLRGKSPGKEDDR